MLIAETRKNLTGDQRRHFRDELRTARATALRDAEGFLDVIVVLERLGLFLHGKLESLGAYSGEIASLAGDSPLANDLPKGQPFWHSSFREMYNLVRDARNDAVHQGAYARHLSAHLVKIALILEDALMSEAHTVAEFMVRDPVCAEEWHPLSFVRQQMLTNSFSYLPARGQDGSWSLISDFEVGRYLVKGDRKSKLAKTLGQARVDGLAICPTKPCAPNTTTGVALELSQGKPLLVVDSTDSNRLLGIVTPFDLL